MTSFVCLGSIYYINKSETNNTTDQTVGIAIWSTVENGVGITAGCVATLRPLVSMTLKKFGMRSGFESRGPSRATDIPKDIPRGHRMSLQAMSFGNRAHNGHGTVTTITGQRGKDHSRGSSEEPLAVYPGKIGKSFYVETDVETDESQYHARSLEDPYLGQPQRI